MRRILILCFIIALSVVFTQCRRDRFTSSPDAALSFDNDTVIFDTVFTSVGSATKRLTVYNPHGQSIRIDRIHLAGASSNFRMNVDGMPGNDFKDVVIKGGDSIFVFAEVTVDPNNGTTPLIITDSIIFETNGNVQDVDLVAWGQDAYFYGPYTEIPTGTLNPDKPHVFYGYSFVDTNSCLTVPAGTRIHFHKYSGLIVLYDACLNVDGTVQDPVIIQGDRLEWDYHDVPGQWDRIWFSAGSRNNIIKNAIIKNGNIGLQVDTLGNSSNPTLTLYNTQVINMSGLCLLAQGSYVDAENCVFGNAGQYLAALTIGGDYSFRHCSFGNFWSYSNRSTPSVHISNWYEASGGQTIVRDLTQAYFGNCIIHGARDEELEISKKSGGSFNYSFDHCIMRSKENIDFTQSNYSAITNYLGNIMYDNSSHDAVFNDPSNSDFGLFDASAAIDLGDINITNSDAPLSTDIAGNTRGSDPDLGAYEY